MITILYDTVLMGTCHYTFDKTHRIYSMMSMNGDVNCGLWVVMMYHFRFTDYDKFSILVGDVGNGRACVYVVGKGVCGKFILSA